MSFTTLRSTQNKFLETYLRGTDQTLTTAQASSLFGIQSLRGRLSEMRALGLNVQRVPTKTTGKSAYRISRRDIFGSQGRTI